MKKATNIEIELRKGNDDKISFYLKQYDDVILNIKVYDGLSPINLEGETVYLAIDKPDGAKVLQKDNILVDGHSVEVKLSPQAVTVAGICKMELILQGEEGLSTTAITNYMVSEAIGSSIVDIITSSNDIHHLKLIEDFILNSNFAIEDINYSLNAVRERISEIEAELNDNFGIVLEDIEITGEKVIESIETVKTDVITEINEVKSVILEDVDTAKDEILSKGNEVIANVETAKGEVYELMATIEASKEEVDEMGQVQVENIIGAGRRAIIELDEAKADALEVIRDRANIVVDEAVTGITRIKDDAINEMSTEKARIVSRASEEMTTKKDEIVAETGDSLEEIKTDAINEINETKDEAVSQINETIDTLEDVKESAVTEITETKDNAVEEVANAVSTVEETKNDAINTITEAKETAINEVSDVITVVEETKDEAVNIIETAKNEAVGVLETTKNTTIDEMVQAKDNLIEELSQVEVGTVEGVNEAVQLAQKRLQEETIKSMWEVQECSANEKETIEAVSRQEQSTLSDKSWEHIERINNAGASILETVESLDANIEQGLNDIDRTIREGKTEIRDLSSTQLEAIRAEGAEILDLVANIDSITGDYIDRINRAGEGARNTIEAKSLTEQREINRVALEQKDSIREAGNEKLEEINSILGVSKGEVEELLSTTRQEINTHRSDFANKVADSKEEINTLKDNSMSEMTTKKDELIEEILGSEIALKEDFKTLKDEYIAEIDARGTSRVDNLQRMIDAIDALEEAVNRRLEISEKRSETLENTLINIDNKVVEIQPVLDNLSEMRNICISLQRENEEANANIEEMDFLHIESDTRIVELRRLIQEAKQYEEVVQRYIDSKSGGHEEIEARLLVLEEAIGNIMTREEVEEAIAKEIDTINDVLSNKVAFEDLNDYASGKLMGRFGESVYIHKNNAFTTTTGDRLDFTPTHTLQFTYLASGNYQYITFYFKCDLDNDVNKYISLEGNILTLHGMTRNVDYVSVSGKGTGYTDKQEFKLDGTYRINQLDCNLYNADRSTIVVANPKSAGLSSFNEAKETGIYTIDLPLSSYKKMPGCVKLNANAPIKGILEVINVGNSTLQKKTLYSVGQCYVRVLGGEWTRIDGDKNTESKMRIGVAKGESIPLIVQTAPSNPFFWDNNTGYIIFRTHENSYKAIYMFNAKLKTYYTGSTSIYISHSNRDVAHFTSSDGVNWKVTDNIATSSTIGNISVDKSFFKVYACSHPVYTSSSYTDVYQEATEIDLNTEETLNNFRDITEAGIYEVDIKVGDDISHAPYSDTITMYAIDNEEYMEMYDEDGDGFITEEVYKQTPALLDLSQDTKVYEFSKGIIDRNITGMLNVSIIKNKRYLEFIDDDGTVLRMNYNGNTWTDWR